MQTPTQYAFISNSANIIVTKQNEFTKEILTQDCLNYLAMLHRVFNPRRLGLLYERTQKQLQLCNGLKYTYPLETEAIRNDPTWKVAPVPKQLEKRWIEITGPASAKGCINAMNSGANVFMADCEDALGPTWENIISAQKYLLETNKRTLKFSQKTKVYEFKRGELATLLVRPRGWHLNENHVMIDEQPMSGSLFDFGVYFYHNYKVRQEMGFGGVYYYLPKLETYKEAQLWADVFAATEQYFNAQVSTIRATVLIETIGGAIDMEEIVYVLKNYLVGLNAGRWDYIFSCIKKSQGQKDITFPDRGQVTMEVPFMRAYTNRLVQICHKRGAHAIGGMAAFIPSQSDQKANDLAFSKVTHDKQREVRDGFDGSWVAHPGLVKHAQEIFQKALQGADHQKTNLRLDVKVTADQLIDFRMPSGTISEEGVKNNIDVCIQYIYNWLQGTAAVGLYNLMEDAATAEIARGQIWQWIQNGSKTTNGITISAQYYKKLRSAIVESLSKSLKNHAVFQQAVQLTDRLILSSDFLEFLTNPAYEMICGKCPQTCNKCPFSCYSGSKCPYAGYSKL